MISFLRILLLQIRFGSEAARIRNDFFPDPDSAPAKSLVSDGSGFTTLLLMVLFRANRVIFFFTP
jgi:hypothetical protein